MWPQGHPARLWWLLVGFGLMVAALAITLAVEVPIDHQIQGWTAATLPADWRSIQARWERWHSLRTFASIAALVAATLSATIAAPATPPPQRPRRPATRPPRHQGPTGMTVSLGPGPRSPCPHRRRAGSSDRS
jgi:hypothetical protein